RLDKLPVMVFLNKFDELIFERATIDAVEVVGHRQNGEFSQSELIVGFAHIDGRFFDPSSVGGCAESQQQNHSENAHMYNSVQFCLPEVKFASSRRGL